MEELVKKHAQTLEDALTFLGINPVDSRTGLPNQWAIQKISSKVLVFLILRAIKTPNGQQVMMYALSELEELGAEHRKAEFLHKLLYLNHTSANCCFSIYNDKICLRSSRYAHGLDKEEAVMIITDILQSAEVAKKSLLRVTEAEASSPDVASTDGDSDIDMV